MSDEPERIYFGNGRYALDRILGSGGAGVVYLAFDTMLDRWVAVKKMGTGDELVTREAKVMASFHHTNIVMLHDIIEEGDGVYFVMELVLGQTLEELAEPMNEEAFREFATQCLLGLGAAHEKNVVHRDIKPGNIMLEPHPSHGYRVKLLDFGQSRALAEPSLQTMDHSGAVVGSIYMMSPEQLSHNPLDHRTDLYSIGCVFYQALTLERPFTGSTVPEVVAAHLQHRFKPLKSLRPDLPVNLTLWVENLFAFDRNDRPASADEAIKNLKATLSHSKVVALSSATKGVRVLDGPILKAAALLDVPKTPIAVVANPASPKPASIRISPQPVVSAIPAVAASPSVSAVPVAAAAPVIASQMPVVAAVSIAAAAPVIAAPSPVVTALPVAVPKPVISTAVPVVAATPVVYPTSQGVQPIQPPQPINPVRVVAAAPVPAPMPAVVLPTAKIAEVKSVVLPKVSLPPR